MPNTNFAASPHSEISPNFAATQSPARGLRPHISLVGKCNAGKSSLLNALVEQDLAIVSSTPGTTTDPVLRNCELLPFGPVVFVDTPGMDDSTSLGALRREKTKKVLTESHLVVYVLNPQNIDEEDLQTLQNLKAKGKGLVVVLTHADLADFSELPGLALLKSQEIVFHSCSSVNKQGIAELRQALAKILQQENKNPPKLMADLVSSYKLVLLVVPIDLEAPAGRLILPQVQTIREVLDADSATLVVKERELSWALDRLKSPPDLVITDSQVILKAAGALPRSIPLTTFSILFSRLKGDLPKFVENVAKIDQLTSHSKVLVTESCSHHAHCDDIGRVKIPRWLRQYTGKDLTIDHSGGSLPSNLSDYDLIIHCGACMLTRPQMISRLEDCLEQQIAITNYGVAISYLHGLLDRVLEPFDLGVNQTEPRP